MNPYDTAPHRKLDVIEPPPWRPDPTPPDSGEHIVYESTLEAQYRASAATVPRLPRLSPMAEMMLGAHLRVVK